MPAPNWVTADIGRFALAFAPTATSMELELARMREAAANPNVHALSGDELMLDRVRILGCTLWTDFRLRIDVHAFPADPGERVQKVSDMRLAMDRVPKVLAPTGN